MIDEQTLTAVVDFHGHMCPGLAVGIRAAEAALREIGPHAGDEEVVCITETDMCAVDAIQYLTGCTFGKGNLVHRDHGKNSFTVWRRSDGRAVRITTRPGAWGEGGPEEEERQALFARVRADAATPDERIRFQELHARRARSILEAPEETVIEVVEVDATPPHRARILASVECAECGESVMETRVRRFGGRLLCAPCFEAAIG